MSDGIMSLLTDRGRDSRGRVSDAGALLDMSADQLRSGQWEHAQTLAIMSIASSMLKAVEKLGDIESSLEVLNGR